MKRHFMIIFAGKTGCIIYHWNVHKAKEFNKGDLKNPDNNKKTECAGTTFNDEKALGLDIIIILVWQEAH